MWLCVVVLLLASAAGGHGILLFERSVGMSAVEADVVVAEYALIRRDFPCLRDASAADIDAWLVSTAAFMRSSHVEGVPEHMRPQLRAAANVTGLLPPMYGRAAVVRLSWPGTMCGTASPRYLDIKGSGTDRPHAAMHGTGVLELSKAAQEFMIAQWLHHAAHLAPRLNAARVYAVLRVRGCWDFLPTKYLAVDNRTWLEAPGSCGILVREFASRPGNYLFDAEQQLAIEAALHPFGLTGVVPYLAHRYGGQVPRRQLLDSPLVLDFQATDDGRLIDLNTVVAWSPDAAMTVWHSKRGTLVPITELNTCLAVVGSGVRLKYSDCLSLLRKTHLWTSLAAASERVFAQPPQLNPLGVRPLHDASSCMLRHSWWALCGALAERCRADLVRLLTTDSSGSDFAVFQSLLHHLHAGLHQSYPLVSKSKSKNHSKIKK